MNDLNILTYEAPIRRTPSQQGKGLLALGLSMLLPGLGQIMAGEKRRGTKWLIAWLTTFALFAVPFFIWKLVPALVVLVPVHTIIAIASWIDAFRVGKRSTGSIIESPARRTLVGLILIVVALTVNPQLPIALLMRRYLMEAFRTPTPSMAPTIQVGDRFLVHKHLSIERWSIVVFYAPEAIGQKYDKRVVGLPGETVDLIAGQVHINGKQIPLPPGQTPYISKLPYNYDGGNGCEGHPITLGRDEYYVLGDNSPISSDSRYWRTALHGHQPGTIGGEDILGVVTWIYWPPARWRRLRE